jgi:hypothetical protein
VEEEVYSMLDLVDTPQEDSSETGAWEKREPGRHLPPPRSLLLVLNLKCLLSVELKKSIGLRILVGILACL